MKNFVKFIAGWLAMGFVFAFVAWMFNGFEGNYCVNLKHQGVWMATFFLGWLGGLFATTDIDEIMS